MVYSIKPIHEATEQRKNNSKILQNLPIALEGEYQYALKNSVS